MISLLPYKTILAYCNFPPLTDMHTVTRTRRALHHCCEPKQEQMWAGDMLSVFPFAFVAHGITLPRIGQDKLISGRVVWKLLWSALCSSRHLFFFFSLSSIKVKTSEHWDAVTQLLRTRLPDPFSLHVAVEARSEDRHKDEPRKWISLRVK